MWNGVFKENEILSGYKVRDEGIWESGKVSYRKSHLAVY